MQIDEGICDYIARAAAETGVQTISVDQRYENIDDIVTVVLVGIQENEGALDAFETILGKLESQVIVVKESA